MTKHSGWGNFPKITGKVIPLISKADLLGRLENMEDVIAKGNGRSYGDSSLSENVINTLPCEQFINFDSSNGELTVQSGVLLKDIVEVFVPRGWFLAVTPGTKLITVGGAIASDVHGKNHHIQGCFSEFLVSFEIMQSNGSILTCSRKNNAELFKATCAGQGLTGIILNATIQLVKISSRWIDQSNFKTNNLKHTIDIFQQHETSPFSVAWIDCTASGDQLGRSHVSIGKFKDDGDLAYRPKRRLNVPFFLPKICLNSFTLRLFNLIYYHRQLVPVKHSEVDIDSFFYPLDMIRNWNRIYGKSGFVQYQFVLPLENSYEGLHRILTIISATKKGSFLAVLKLLGKENQNYLSFPMRGFTLALDFKVEPDLFPLLSQLDQEVEKFGGRVYLAKDARISKDTFEAGYPKIELFRQFRHGNKLHETFNSLQSKRLDL